MIPASKIVDTIRKNLYCVPLHLRWTLKEAADLIENQEEYIEKLMKEKIGKGRNKNEIK